MLYSMGIEKDVVIGNQLKVPSLIDVDPKRELNNTLLFKKDLEGGYYTNQCAH